MIRLRAASRLHFGLLNLGTHEAWLNLRGEATVPARRFGGAGLMIEEPGLELCAEPSREWSVREAPLAGRVRGYLKSCLERFTDAKNTPHLLWIKSAPPEHAGLGTGTQLGLTVASCVAHVAGHSEMEAADLAALVGRGARSAIGIHGFDHGGFLVEAGQRQPGQTGTLVCKLPFPDEWRVLLICPRGQSSTHGAAELQAFADLEVRTSDEAATSTLCRLAMIGMVPCLAERDFAGFCEALFDFNARVGSLFRSIQGGLYARPDVANWVGYLRTIGVRGVGQSSWGPTVFAMLEDAERAKDVAARLQTQFGFGDADLFVTKGCNSGAALTMD